MTTATDLPKLSKAGYPEYVPVLEEKDFCRHHYKKGKLHCMVGWINTIFPSCPDEFSDQDYDICDWRRTRANRRVREVLIKIILAEVEKAAPETHITYCIEECHDSISRELGWNHEVLARLFNRFVFRISFAFSFHNAFSFS